MIRTALAAILLAAAVAIADEPSKFPLPPHDSTVKSVYDGDTMTLATGDRVRLRWVNTPELKPAEDYGPEARAATERFVLNRSVELLLGSENPRDGYGRIVAGIQTDEGSLSLHLLALGLAHLFVIPPDDTDLAPMIAAQEAARAAKRGIWSSDRYQGALHITSFHANAAGDDRENVNGEYLRICNLTTAPLDLDGYRITKSTGQSFAIPRATIPGGYTFELHSGVGAQQVDPRAQIALFLGSGEPVWANDGDRATLYDPLGKVVDAREHTAENPSE
jgi:endonuclease YncB( thermonuclease family)